MVYKLEKIKEDLDNRPGRISYECIEIYNKSEIAFNRDNMVISAGSMIVDGNIIKKKERIIRNVNTHPITDYYRPEHKKRKQSSEKYYRLKGEKENERT